ncbi:MAG TPA: 30S ribosomal protein S6 [Chloroflexi bacterium]|jgi:small subunit ribosomal protein S6|nr:30S ribosomal protein S6 [Chloroflexota bacterium]HPO59265.1 30S ribosomal protein S6 [Anaerolineaceae bacterium]
MRNYELVFIVHPDLDQEALTGVIDRVKGWITDAGGSVEKVDVWGKRRLAYMINKQREGQYVYVESKLPPEATAELDRNLRFLEPVLRHLLINPEL